MTLGNYLKLIAELERVSVTTTDYVRMRGRAKRLLAQIRGS